MIPFLSRLLFIAFSLLTSITAHAQVTPQVCRPEQKGDAAWPITGASFVLMYKDPANKAASKDVLKFFTWAFKDGQQLALDLDYVPLPDALTKAIAAKVWTQIKH